MCGAAKRGFRHSPLCCRTKDEMYRHLSIDVDRVDGESDPWSVGQGVEKFFRAGKVAVSCEECKEGKTATQTQSILEW